MFLPYLVFFFALALKVEASFYGSGEESQIPDYAGFVFNFFDFLIVCCTKIELECSSPKSLARLGAEALE